MKKLAQWCLIGLFILVLVEGNIAFDSTYEALHFWFNRLVPSLFVQMVIMSLSMNYQVFDLLKWITSPLKFIFNMNQGGVNLLISCLFLGAPAGPILVNQLVKDHRLTQDEARRLIYCISLATPSFIVVTCGAVFLNSILMGFILWLIQIGCCLLFLLLFREPMIQINPIEKTDPFFPVLRNAIKNTGISLFFIGGYLMMVLTVLNIVTVTFPVSTINIIKSITEFSLASQMVSQFNIHVTLKFVMLAAILGFNGLCVHLQSFSLTDEIKLNYFFYLALRVFQACISGAISLIVVSLLF